MNHPDTLTLYHMLSYTAGIIFGKRRFLFTGAMLRRASQLYSEERRENKQSTEKCFSVVSSTFLREAISDRKIKIFEEIANEIKTHQANVTKAGGESPKSGYIVFDDIKDQQFESNWRVHRGRAQVRRTEVRRPRRSRRGQNRLRSKGQIRCVQCKLRIV